jgi:hypothetical protein
MRPWERKLALSLAAIAAGIALWTASCESRAESPTAQTQSAKPWTIAQCDRLGWRAIAVANISIWNKGGWPLWRVVCVYPSTRTVPL